MGAEHQELGWVRVEAALFVLSAKRFGRHLRAITREAHNLNTRMTTMRSGWFNVAGALASGCWGGWRASTAPSTPAPGGHVKASLATVLVHGWGGALAIRDGCCHHAISLLSSYGDIGAPVRGIDRRQQQEALMWPSRRVGVSI